jgi:hypothetical protein
MGVSPHFFPLTLSLPKGGAEVILMLAAADFCGTGFGLGFGLGLGLGLGFGFGSTFGSGLGSGFFSTVTRATVDFEGLAFETTLIIVLPGLIPFTRPLDIVATFGSKELHVTAGSA